MNTDFEMHRETYTDKLVVNKDKWIDDIVHTSYMLNPYDRGLVYDFGKNGNLKLYISKDDDLDLRFFVDTWDDTAGPDCGSFVEVEESDFFYCRDEKEMKKFRLDLERIWDEDYVID